MNKKSKKIYEMNAIDKWCWLFIIKLIKLF